MTLDRATIILTDAYDAASSAAQIATVEHCAKMGQKVILVVRPSASREEADLRRADALGPSSDPLARAIVLNAGPIEVASRLSQTLADRGLSVALVDARRAAPVTRGHPLDAQPRHIRGGWFERIFRHADIIVVPGGVGLDDEGRATHLGEGGASLTAVFLADALALPLMLASSDPDRPAEEQLRSRKARLLARDRGVRVEHADQPIWFAGATEPSPLRRLCDGPIPA